MIKGCSSNNYLIRKPEGQATSGPCSCSAAKYRLAVYERVCKYIIDGGVPYDPYDAIEGIKSIMVEVLYED